MTLNRLEVQRRYRERHRDRLNAEQRERRARKRAAMTEQEKAAERARKGASNKRFKANNPEYFREYQRANADKYRERSRAWRLANPELARESSRKWRSRNWDRVLASLQRRRARRRGAAGTFTVQQAKGRFAYYGGRCWMCGEPATVMDHVKALVLGGSNWPANLRPACAPCNGRKGAYEAIAAAKLKRRDFR